MRTMILLDDSMGDVVGNVQDRLGLLSFLELAQLDQAAHQRACRVIQSHQLLIIGKQCSLNNQLDSNQGSKISNSILYFFPTTYIVWPGLHCNALFIVHHLQYTSRSDSGSPCMWLSSHRHTPVISIVFKTCECCIDFFQLAVIKDTTRIARQQN